VQIVADRADHHLAGVQPHADLDEYAFGPPHGLGILLDRVLHPERRVARPHRVILMSQRCPEEGHDPVAHDLVDGAFVAVDRLHHPLEHGVEKLPGLFGVPVGEQLHRPLEVCEEDGDLLALALESRPRGQDAIGQVPGCVRLRRWRPSGRRDGRPALATEPSASGQLGRASGADDRQPGAAPEAELRLRRIVRLAPETLHARASSRPGR
jgi:hypothetical protein